MVAGVSQLCNERHFQHHSGLCLWREPLELSHCIWHGGEETATVSQLGTEVGGVSSEGVPTRCSRAIAFLCCTAKMLAHIAGHPSRTGFY